MCMKIWDMYPSFYIHPFSVDSLHSIIHIWDAANAPVHTHAYDISTAQYYDGVVHVSQARVFFLPCGSCVWCAWQLCDRRQSHEFSIRIHRLIACAPDMYAKEKILLPYLRQLNLFSVSLFFFSVCLFFSPRFVFLHIYIFFFLLCACEWMLVCACRNQVSIRFEESERPTHTHTHTHSVDCNEIHTLCRIFTFSHKRTKIPGSLFRATTKALRTTFICMLYGLGRTRPIASIYERSSFSA